MPPPAATPADRPWSPASIPDQSGRTVVVTGANSGIGYVTAREFAGRGATVVLACRNLDRARAAAARISDHPGGGSVLVRRLDLGDLASVRAFAADWDLGAVDVLVNNAGVALAPRGRTVDGFETHLGVNFLGHFALTGLLLPRLLAAPAPRVLTVSSEAQWLGRVDVAGLTGDRGYRRFGAYTRSKKANVYFAVQLQRRLAAGGTSLRSMAVVPGFTATNVLRSEEHRHDGWGWRAFAAVAYPFAQPVEAGAATTLYAATAPDLPGGSYVAPSGPLELRGRPMPRNGRRAARDRATAERLWAAAEKLTGVRYPPPDAAPAP